MKKFIGAICSALAGILTFVWLSLDWIAVKVSGGGETERDGLASGWELIENEGGALSEVNGYMLYKIFAIIMLVVAVLLIIMAVVLLLNSFNIIKLKFNLNMINNILLTVLVLSIIMAIVGVAIMGSKLGGKGTITTISYYPTVGAWLQLITGVVACGLGWALARKAK